jgi:hypothetical protein
VSVIIGFLNVFLWSANVWFLYKETKWYRPNPGKLGSSIEYRKGWNGTVLYMDFVTIL